MKVEKWRSINIKDPRLKCVRKNLRTILNLTIDKEHDRLTLLENLYRYKKNLTFSQDKRFSQLIKQKNELISARSYSILNCSGGSPSHIKGFDRDMVWDPVSKCWMCIGCYKYFFRTESDKIYYKRYIEKEQKCEDNEIKKWD